MPTLKGAVDRDGALLNIEFGVSASAIQNLRASHRPIPQPVSAIAVVDSGAEVTCLDTSLVQKLGLSVVGFSTANVPAIGGVHFSAMHAVSLTIRHPSGHAGGNLVIPDLPVLEVPLGVLGYHSLIGRDVLAKCHFVYDGPGSWFEFSY
jgi:hypothetical protein